MILDRTVYAFLKNPDGLVFSLTLEVFHKYYCINSFPITRCPFCGSERIKKNGKDPNGVQKYYCLDNGAHFLPTTKTIFEDRKIPITEWIEYWRNLIQYNQLNPVNQKHNHLKKFLNAHSGFIREELLDYINLFLLITNPPKEKLEKIDILLNLGFQSAVSLKYRAYFKKKPHD